MLGLAGWTVSWGLLCLVCLTTPGSGSLRAGTEPHSEGRHQNPDAGLTCLWPPCTPGRAESPAAPGVPLMDGWWVGT